MAGLPAIVARRSEFRWSWFGSRLHTFVFVVEPGEIDVDGAAELVRAAQQHAIDNKGGLPRGMQTGTASIPVLVVPAAHDALRERFAAEPKHRYAALVLPVLAEPGGLTYFTGKKFVGSVYASYLRGIVEGVIRPSLAR